jgi:alkylated DNA repair dioxygenase AlkB
LANYYVNGKKSIGYHSDNEEKGDIECIASISLGAERIFSFRSKATNSISRIKLSNGSLLVMDKGCQDNYDHCLVQDKSITNGRLNLTFRSFKFEQYSKN